MLRRSFKARVAIRTCVFHSAQFTGEARCTTRRRRIMLAAQRARKKRAPASHARKRKGSHCRLDFDLGGAAPVKAEPGVEDWTCLASCTGSKRRGLVPATDALRIALGWLAAKGNAVLVETALVETAVGETTAGLATH